MHNTIVLLMAEIEITGVSAEASIMVLDQGDPQADMVDL